MSRTVAQAGGVLCAPGRQEAQAQVLGALRELQESVASANSHVHHFASEVELLQSKMGALHKASALIYAPFRDSLVEGAKADKAGRDR
jgi:hypothetical protein